MNKKQAELIRKHGENLNKIFKTGIEPITLCKKLRRLEVAANRKMVDYCNGAINGDNIDRYEEKSLLPALAKILGKSALKKIHINRDPRGYTLKLTKKESRKHSGIHKDLGGYVILAPLE